MRNLMQLILIEIFLISIQIIRILGECGYNSCAKYDPKKLNIHVIAHSHDDVGYIKTIDENYEQDIKHIITNVVQSLCIGPKRTFTQVEIYYFNRWWREQHNDNKTLVHILVNSGQLSFTNGGYCMNDEGTTCYNGIIDQMTLGLRILDDLFGKCGHPSVSWQIDPFGASKEMASLYAQMGFNGHVTNIKPKGEFIWRGSHDLGDKSEIFTTVLHDHFGPPCGFDYETGIKFNLKKVYIFLFSKQIKFKI
jgi:lysosomal alpha-mannosidase